MVVARTTRMAFCGSPRRPTSRAPASITVTPSDGGASTGDSFNVNFVADTVNEPPFLGPIANQTTTVGTGVTFQLTSTDLEGDAVTYSVLGATANGQAISVQSTIDQATGRVTVTPPAGFVGDIELKVGVKDASGVNDTQSVKLDRGAGRTFDLNASRDTGVFNDDNVTGVNTPTLTVLAPAGQTVTVTVNGTSVGTATATRTAGPVHDHNSGRHAQGGQRTPSPARRTSSDTPLTPLTLTYAAEPAERLRRPRRDRHLAAAHLHASPRRESSSRTSSASSRSETRPARSARSSPGNAGYFAAAMARRQVVFAQGSAVGTSTNTVTVNGGDMLVMYIVQNNTTREPAGPEPGERDNPDTVGTTVAFFSLTGANPDHSPTSRRPMTRREPGDLRLGRPHGRRRSGLQRRGGLGAARGRCPAGDAHRSGCDGSGHVNLIAQLETPKKAQFADKPNTDTPATGEVGVIVADDSTGKIGTLNPGDAGYAAAALAGARFSSTRGRTPARVRLSRP